MDPAASGVQFLGNKRLAHASVLRLAEIATILHLWCMFLPLSFFCIKTQFIWGACGALVLDTILHQQDAGVRYAMA